VTSGRSSALSGSVWKRTWRPWKRICAGWSTPSAAGTTTPRFAATTGWRQVPYWAAGSSFLGYSTGYFAGDWSSSTDAVRDAVGFCLIGPRIGAAGLMGDPSLLGIGDGGGGGGGGGGDGGGGC
jgi:hypothetical protein